MRPTLFTLVSLVFVGFFARLIPHPFNFTPIVGMTLLAGIYARPRWVALAVPFAAMFVSDLVLNNTVYASFYEGIQVFGSWGVYVALGLCALLPLAANVGRQAGWTKLLGAGVGGSLLFFLVTNAAVWATSGIYPLNAAGLAASLAAGLPFFPATLASTLLFGGIGVWVMREYSFRGAPDTELTLSHR